MASTTAIYTAKLELRSGVSVGDSEQMVFNVKSFSRSVNRSGSSDYTIGGVRQDVLNYIKKRWRVESTSVSGADRENMDEFVFSASDGHQFTITIPDEDDRVADVIMVDGQFSRRRVSDALLDDYFYSFTVEEV